jgi:origin recognition complex subunit 4
LQLHHALQHYAKKETSKTKARRAAKAAKAKRDDEKAARERVVFDDEYEVDQDQPCVVCNSGDVYYADGGVDGDAGGDGDDDAKPVNDIVFCELCDRCYHQNCHPGLETIPDDDWYCHQCTPLAALQSYLADAAAESTPCARCK